MLPPLEPEGLGAMKDKAEEQGNNLIAVITHKDLEEVTPDSHDESL
ncbi:MAG: hypothetical protein ACJ0GY_03580 [Synechococcus sp.]|nr:hypothetical protein SynPROS91_01656 [Synechococcus sp. PROS-9-1]